MVMSYVNTSTVSRTLIYFFKFLEILGKVAYILDSLLRVFGSVNSVFLFNYINEKLLVNDYQLKLSLDYLKVYFFEVDPKLKIPRKSIRVTFLS